MADYQLSTAVSNASRESIRGALHTALDQQIDFFAFCKLAYMSWDEWAAHYVRTPKVIAILGQQPQFIGQKYGVRMDANAQVYGVTVDYAKEGVWIATVNRVVMKVAKTAGGAAAKKAATAAAGAAAKMAAKSAFAAIPLVGWVSLALTAYDIYDLYKVYDKARKSLVDAITDGLVKEI